MKRRLLLLALGVSLCVGAFPLVSAVAAVQPQPSVSRSAAVSGSAVVAEAERFVGYPYSYTGDSPATGFSCIGFVWYVYQQLGENIPGTLSTAMAAFPQVSESALLPGDIIFFQNTWWAGVSHVAIYIGGGKIVHAENPQNGVTISSISGDPRDGDYWQQHYLVAERPWTGGTGTPPVRRHHGHHFVFVNTSNLNLRSGPSTGYSVVTTLAYGTKLRVEGWAPGWVRVRTLSRAVGWVMRVGVSRTLTYVHPRGRERHHLRHAAKAAWSDAKTVYVNGLNVHRHPSVAAPVIMSLSRGTRVGILRQRGSWDKILIVGGRRGWVEAQYVGRHATVVRSHHRTVRPGHTPAVAGVNVHSRAGLHSPVVGVTNGANVHVLKWGHRWARIRLSTGVTGWILRQFVGNASAGHSSGRHSSRDSGTSGPYARVTVRLHATASLSGRVIGLVYAGSHVTVLRAVSGWDLVRLHTGTTGYVDSQYLAG